MPSAQLFEPSQPSLQKVSLLLDSGPGNALVSIRSSLTGPDLAGPVSVPVSGGNAQWYDFVFPTPLAVTPGQNYYIVAWQADPSNFIYFSFSQTPYDYASGELYHSYDGSTFVPMDGDNPIDYMAFKEYSSNPNLTSPRRGGLTTQKSSTRPNTRR